MHGLGQSPFSPTYSSSVPPPQEPDPTAQNQGEPIPAAAAAATPAAATYVPLYGPIPIPKGSAPEAAHGNRPRVGSITWSRVAPSGRGSSSGSPQPPPSITGRDSSSGTPQPTSAPPLLRAISPPLKPPAEISPRATNSPLISPEGEVDLAAMKRFFSSTAVGMKRDCKVPIDEVLVTLQMMGQALMNVSDNKPHSIQSYDGARKMYETYLARLFTRLQLEQKVAEIQAPNQQCEINFVNDLKVLLSERVFLELREPVNFFHNRKILSAFIPECDRLFQQMDSLEQANRLLESQGDNGSPYWTPEERKQKLLNDHQLLRIAQTIFDQYRAAIDALCKNIQAVNPAGELTGSPRGTVLENILYLIKRNLESGMATLNSDRKDARKEMIARWLKKAHDSIRYEHLESVQKVMIERNRALLLENIRLLPHEVNSFEDFVRRLFNKLFVEKLPNPSDVQRAMTLEHSNRCFINDQEIKPTNTPAGRYHALLSTFSDLFGQPTLFQFFAEQISLTINNFNGTFDYRTPYLRLMDMPEEEKASIRVKTEAQYRVNFDRAWKYFKFSQNVLGQGILYYFTVAVLGARVSKLGVPSSLKAPNLNGEQKNEFIIKVKGTTCEISIKRLDGIVDPNVILTQTYTIQIDVDRDTIDIRDLKMQINCPSNLPTENEEVKRMLFDFPLIMEALGFPPLIINYIDPPKPPPS